MQRQVHLGGSTSPDTEICPSARRGPCQDILLWYLSHAETRQALDVVRQLSGLQGHGIVADGFHFSPGSDGGVRFCSTESSR